MEQIDVMLRELQLMRAKLVSEIRDADDADGARAGALLAGRKAAGDA